MAKKKSVQKRLDIGNQDGQIKELEDLGDELDSIRTKRISLQAEEKDTQDRLVKAMQKHKVSTYKYEDKTLVHEHDEKEKVKIKRPKSEENDG